ncbi:MAG: ABC transporter permease [Oceanospirillaceae bacterium]|nr:ABC transporter permease [Oceanospirillaceae bacterium]
MNKSFAHNRWADTLLGFVGFFILFSVWELVSYTGLISPDIFPAPSIAINFTLSTMPMMEISGHVWASLTRVFWGFAIGASLGVVVGVASGWYNWLGVLTRPLIELTRPIPPLAWIPMAIIWFGLGEPSKIFVISLGAFFPVVTSAYKGMTSVDPVLLRAAQTMGLKGWRILIHVALPASLPDLATGIRVGWGLSFGMLVAAELVAASEGMGFMIMHARELGQVEIIIFGIVLIGVVNLITDYAIGVVIRRHIGKWHAY